MKDFFFVRFDDEGEVRKLIRVKAASGRAASRRLSEVLGVSVEQLEDWGYEGPVTSDNLEYIEE